jgi:hypothetical protein
MASICKKMEILPQPLLRETIICAKKSTRETDGSFLDLLVSVSLVFKLRIVLFFGRFL